MERIIVVTEPGLEQNASRCLECFQSRYPHLEQVDMVFAPDEQYSLYQDDVNRIRRGWSQNAEIIDTRDLAEHQDEPVRLLLTTQFLESGQEEQDSVLLHEIGHYMTNPRLIGVRRYISRTDPPLLSANVSGPNTPRIRSLIGRHNKGLNYIFQLPKLPQEVNAELWVYENHSEISKARIEDYRRTDVENLQLLRGLRVQREFLYDIPNIVFAVTWKQAFLRWMDFEFVADYLDEVNNMWTELLSFSATVSLERLKILTLHDEFLQTLEYKDEKLDRLIELYEDTFREFIIESAGFFPISARPQILNLYGVEAA